MHAAPQLIYRRLFGLHLRTDEKNFEILVIDDNPACAALFKHSWAECKEASSGNALMQDLVMLDYRHPMNGGLA